MSIDGAQTRARASKANAMSGVDTENFIEDIYDKPIIWNRNCISNKALTEKTWIELSKKYRTSSE